MFRDTQYNSTIYYLFIWWVSYVLEWGPSLPVLKYEYNLRPIQHFLLISSTRNLGYCYWSTHSRTDRALSVLLCVKIYCYQSHITDTRNPSIWNFKKFQIDHPRSGTSDCSTDSIFLCVYAICVPVGYCYWSRHSRTDHYDAFCRQRWKISTGALRELKYYYLGLCNLYS